MTARVARPDSLALQQMWWMSRVVASEGASASTRLRRDVRVLDAGMWSRIMLLAPLRVGYGSRVRAKETWNRSSAPHSTVRLISVVWKQKLPVSTIVEGAHQRQEMRLLLLSLRRACSLPRARVRR